MSAGPSGRTLPELRDLAFIALALAACTESRSTPEGYLVRSSVDAAAIGHAGDRLELLEDERIPDSLRATLAPWSDGDPCADPADGEFSSFCASLATAPLRPAILRVVSRTGVERSKLTLERPVAELQSVGVPHGPDSLLTVTVDLSAGVGSYSGPLSRLPLVAGGRLQWARAVDTATNESAEIDLVTTLKSAWQVDTFADQPTLLQVECRPDLARAARRRGKQTFTISYTRYVRDGARWHRAVRQQPGFWEDDDFPSRALFP